ncbi:hypothetical protein S1OALGB6SA_1059 [Olavius algarvensis spirochete endosymbiont]|uniref:(d)CMP kinase n=1 Tax=Olavius algarvensis spirochete endosymbiont TaxID=260710 RepID=UPI000F14A44B|nr:cytidylate kinase family protein [Olavius algarvensis spirochete endosymbiont]VDA99985.1 hypothetical protein S1OALGB6SA_1059 [Olavius algarvensis spirochete endosymbiont]
MSYKNRLQIAISGCSGCGNSTVSRILAERLNLYLVNYTFRSIAAEDGISFEEVCRRAEIEDKYDLRVDQTQVILARKSPSVLSSRLAIWLLDEADIKVFLKGSLEIRARRIQQREGGSMEDLLNTTALRDKRDHERYWRLYGIDNYDYSKADLIVDTDGLDAPQVVDRIEEAVRKLK